VLFKAAGAEVELDEVDDPDMLKVRFGRYSYDLSGGLVPHLRYMARMVGALNEKDPAKDMEYLTKRYLRSKLSPTAGAVVNSFVKEDYIGEPTNWKDEAKGLFNPLSVENFSEAANAEGLPGILKTTPEFFGIGVTRYATPAEYWAKAKAETVKLNNAKSRAEKDEHRRRIQAYTKLAQRAGQNDREDEREKARGQ
jgi:hypothetical protein